MLTLLITLPCAAADKTCSRLFFNQSGFSITALEERNPGSAYTVLVMFLPVSDKFAPNVNVTVQPYRGSIQDYVRLTRSQFKSGKFKVLEEKIYPDEAVWEYAGRMGELALHWYARAVSRNNQVYLVTATAAEIQWPGLSARMKRCVDSFRIEKQVPGK